MLIASKQDNTLKISILGEIMGESEWFHSDAAILGTVLAQAEGENIEVWLSSPGGSMDAAFAMRALLADYPGQVTINTCGVVASAATLLLCIPDAHVTAQRGSVFMIHTASMGVHGNATELRKGAEVLDVCDDEITQVYKLRLKCGDDELRDMLESEKWMRPEEAQKLGLIDDIAQATSGGYVAEPQNPEPMSEPDRAEDITQAVSACLSPRIEAIQSGLVSITASGAERVQAITNAAEKAVSGIVDASDKTVANIVTVGEDVGKAITDQLQALRDEIAECRRSYEVQAKKYAALDETLSRVYALSGGDVSFSAHDEVRRAHGFKLNI